MEEPSIKFLLRARASERARSHHTSHERATRLQQPTAPRVAVSLECCRGHESGGEGEDGSEGRPRGGHLSHANFSRTRETLQKTKERKSQLQQPFLPPLPCPILPSSILLSILGSLYILFLFRPRHCLIQRLQESSKLIHVFPTFPVQVARSKATFPRL